VTRVFVSSGMLRREARKLSTRDGKRPMGICEVCGNEYDMAFEVVAAGARHVFEVSSARSTRWRRFASTVVAG